MSVFFSFFPFGRAIVSPFPFFFLPPPLSFLPLQALSFAVTPSEDERTNDVEGGGGETMASTHAARAVVPFPLPSCYPLPFFLTLTSPPLLSHTASLPPFSSLLQNREETFVFRRDRGGRERGEERRERERGKLKSGRKEEL